MARSSQSRKVLVISLFTIIFSLVNSGILFIYLENTNHYPEFLTKIGRLRAAIQRTAKLASNGRDYQMHAAVVDTYFSDLESGKGMKAFRTPSIAVRIDELKKAWLEIWDACERYRTSGSSADRAGIIDSSERYINIARELSDDAQMVSENAKYILIWLGVMIAINALIILTAVWWLKTMVTDRLEHSATHDQLTGIYNRRIFEQFLENEINICSRQYKEGYRSSLIMFDIDRFKAINDTKGHGAGDMVLKKLSATVQGVIRKSDIFARFGGEEFILIVSGNNARHAMLSAEKLRTTIERTSFFDDVTITASFGITELHEKDAVAAALERADKALYAAKEHGRNQTMRLD
ncbi:MAG: GGDEF domain-containing protein [Spirochaetes bacterium]|nr:GGDEF domain-containing protein [Spirochaetota bacterium]